MKSFEEQFEAICEHARHGAILQSIADVLEWDERTGLPISASEYRSAQISLLRGNTHTHVTDPGYGEKLQTLAQSLAEKARHGYIATTLRGLLRDWRRNCKLPLALVKRLSECRTQSQHTWEHARKADDFEIFAPALKQMVALKREEGALLAEGGDAYEALIDEYEPGASVTSLAEVFDQLRDPLVDLVAELNDAPRKPDLSILQRAFPIEGQRRLSRYVAEAIGFDFRRGRLDETSHPFCTNLGPDDCRILSRYEEHWLPAGLFGTMHEAGHGMYEQGLDRQWYGLPPGSYVSLGIHESQSRLWENQVGRSQAFWRWLLPKAKELIGLPLADVTVDQIYAAVNVVRPSLIRVEADEATYNLHIIIRFELEKSLIGGDLEVADLPAAWDQAYEKYLGIKSPSAANGVLQDVHWSAGLFGYFPTYTLGNLAAAQLFDAASAELGDLQQQIECGNFADLRHWLWQKVHRHGKCYEGDELIENATGEKLSAEPLLASLKARYAAVYV
jgi:carboxypeptidase Taq